jgi:methylmalonyl-CoA/ethylmalonyl-CoA epimerase
MQILHFGFLTTDIDKSLAAFSALGYKETKRIKDHDRKIDIAFIRAASGEIIELVQPLSTDSVVSNITKHYKNDIYHICYATDNMDEDLKKLADNGFLIIDAPKPAVAFNEKKAAFLYSKFAGMLELVEK